MSEGVRKRSWRDGIRGEWGERSEKATERKGE